MSQPDAARRCLAAVLVAAAIAAGEAPSPDRPTTPAPTSITVASLVAQALAQDPALRAAAAEGHAARAAVLGARRWDDPELALEGGRSDEAGDRAWRLRAALRQRVERPALRSATVAAAAGEAEAAGSRAALAEADVLRDVRLAAVEARRADARHEVLAGDAVVAERLAAQARERFAAGQASMAEVLAAEIERDEAHDGVLLAQRAVEAARARLERRSGAVLPRGAVIAPEPAAAEEPTRAAAVAAAGRHASVRAARAEATARRAGAAAAGAAAWPGLRVGVFGERDDEADEVGLELEMALPLWNRNAAATAAARARAAGAEAAAVAALRDAQDEAERAWFAWDVAKLRAEHLERHLVPAAAEARRLALADYAAGVRGLEAVLAATRTAARLRLEQADAVAERERARIGLDLATAAEESP